MNYYFDTEFLEGKQKKKILGVTYGETKPTIDLISIGIVAEDGREYYAISKDFNLDEAWNRFQMTEVSGSITKPKIKEYWIRENVLKSIFVDLLDKARDAEYKANTHFVTVHNIKRLKKFTISNMETLLFEYGKSNEEIAKEIKSFCSERKITLDIPSTKPKFYAYYADYDWVVFCWLFGTMMDLPDGFPMYCVDLKQEIDSTVHGLTKPPSDINTLHTTESWIKWTNDNKVQWITEFHTAYPKQENEHNALDDAKWNKKLHTFIKSL